MEIVLLLIVLHEYRIYEPTGPVLQGRKRPDINPFSG